METLDELNQLERDVRRILIKKLPTYHAIILAKNDIGTRESLPAGLLVPSELFPRRPRMPKSAAVEVPGGTDSSALPVRRENCTRRCFGGSTGGGDRPDS